MNTTASVVMLYIMQSAR